MRLQIAEPIYAAIRRHGERTYPHECCGVLLGLGVDGVNEVRDAIEAGNTRTDSAHNRYHIAPQELISVQRLGRARGLDIVGFYHSHPDHPAQWSATDFAEAHWLGCSYVITEVTKSGAQKTSSFFLAGAGEEDKAFLDQEILVEPMPVPAASGADETRC